MLVILSTHPIQYQAPLWQALAESARIPFEVWYVSDHGTRASHDREFGQTFSWDLPTLEGYPYRFVDSAAGARPVSFWGWRLTRDLKPRLLESKAKALWIQGWHVAAYWQAARMASRAGVPLWMRGESNDLKPTPFPKNLVKRPILGRLLGSVDEFLYVGQANRRLYESYGVPESKLHFAPYAVDNERFAAQAAEIRGQRAEIRRAWGIPDDSFCILFCGKFIGKKHPHSVIDAARALQESRRVPKLHLLFVGSGELGASLRDACSVAFDAEPGGRAQSHAGTPGKPPATFAGFLNQRDISKAYVAADCLVLPSDHGETWGLVVNEALASGLPCVASNACGVTEDLIARRWPERAFPMGDAAGLARSLHAVYTCANVGSETAVVAPYSFQRTCDEVARLYLERK
jgi:glycosyltransferase involved in cell wall biosynthesis